MKRTQTVLSICVGAAVAACMLGGTANAQSAVKGTFTLPYEVRWGRAVLPAGAYTINMESVRGPAILRTAAGTGRGLVLAYSVGPANKDLPTSLLIGQRENQRIVRSFNWREGNRVFEYAPATKAERKIAGKIDDSVVLPIRIAGK